jgi:hypothetical protein
MGQRIRTSPARYLAVLATPLLALGVMAGMAPAASASRLPDRPAGKVPAATAALAAAPASLQAAIRKSRGTAVSFAGYSRQVELTASDAAPGGEFGSSVALSAPGTTALVGEDNRNTGTGAVYVYTLRHGKWSQTAVLTASDGAQFEDFGRSVALSALGSTAVVGANGRNKATGAVYVFTLRHGKWSQAAELTASDAAAGDQFGFSVALSASGSTALVAAIAHHSETGAAYVFTLRHRSWSQTAELTASDAAPGNDFGQSVALSAAGTTALVGDSVRDADTGAVYVFTLRHRTWSQTAELTAATADGLGLSVALSAQGGTVLAGAPFDKTSTGAAYVFTLRRGTWSQAAKLTAADGAQGDTFGISVALSAQGSTALVGAAAFGNSSSEDRSPGAAYVSTLRHRTWSPTTRITAFNAAPSDAFGNSLALSARGTTALVAAPFLSTNAGYAAGAAYVLTEGRRA